MSEGHQAIALWAERTGYTSSIDEGRWREIYLETNDADYSDWLIEVQLELTEAHDHRPPDISTNSLG